MESEFNGALGVADLVGTLTSNSPVSALGSISRSADIDVFHVFTTGATSMDLRILTGASSMGTGTVGAGGGRGQLTSHAFKPTVTLLGPAGRPVFTYSSAKPNLLLTDINLPPHGADFYVMITAQEGGSGQYSLQLNAQ